MDFKEELKQYQEKINKELEKYLRTKNCLEGTLNESMEYSLMAGGKRLRPILVLSTYSLFKNDLEECFPYAIAIEMVHNFSLIHDDLPGIDTAKLLQKNGEMTEDELKHSENEIQKMTDKYIDEVDKVLEKKEKEIMSV